MKLFAIFVFIILLASCSSINVERTSQLQFERLYFAKVEGRKNIILEANESASGRIMVGLLSAGPIGAIATANTEEDFSRPKAFEYTLGVNTNETKVVISRSIADIGSCVEVISPDNSDLELLRIVKAESCQGGYNKVMHSASG